MLRFDKALRLVVAALASLVAVLSFQAFATRPIADWTVFFLSVFLVLLAISVAALFNRRTEYFAMIAALFSSLVVGRLFSTMHFDTPGADAVSGLDPLMIAETGPGIDSIMWTTTVLVIALAILLLRFAWRQSHAGKSGSFMGSPSLNDWSLAFIRIYAGLMFIAHFAGHLFAGPAPFKVFVDYFSSIGLPAPAAFVILAGLIELAVTIGLAFGFLTRIAAVGAAVYLFVSVGLGGHFAVGYIWVLPTGGWEFPALWIFVVAIFALAGGGPASLDRLLGKTFEAKPNGLGRLLAWRTKSAHDRSAVKPVRNARSLRRPA